MPARQALAELLDALRAYAAAVLDALVDGRRLGEQEIRPVALQARLARTNAEATVARSLSEPPAHRIDPGAVARDAGRDQTARPGDPGPAARCA
jgi:hypothetical protein